MKYLILFVALAVGVTSCLVGCAGGADRDVKTVKLDIWQQSMKTYGMVPCTADQVRRFLVVEFRLAGSPAPIPVTLTSERTGEKMSWPTGKGAFRSVEALKAPWIVRAEKEGQSVVIKKIPLPTGLYENTTQIMTSRGWKSVTQVPVGAKTRWLSPTGDLIDVYDPAGPGPKPTSSGVNWTFSTENIGYWIVYDGPGAETAFEVVAS